MDDTELPYEWIRDNIRYVAVAIGIGSYQPHTAESILYNRYGDCKDMTTLLCTMAKEVELDVHQALISTWYNGTIDTALASVSQFNHVIAYCLIDSEEVVWMDATDKACSFDKLPWYDKGTQVLLIKDEGDSEIISTPKVSPTENRKQREWSVNLDSSGSAIVEGKEMLWGAPASELRYELMNKSKSQIRKWMESFITGKCALAKLDTFSIFGVQPIKDPLIVNYKFVSSSFANKIDSRTMVFSPGNVSDMNLFEYFLSEKRVHPIRFRYSLFAKVKFILNLPENWKTKIKNYSNKINSEFGEASWNWFVSGKQLHIQNDYLINGKEIISEQYLKFKDYLKSIEKQELKEVVVVK